MKYKTLFRLLVRLLGLYLVVSSLPWVLVALITFGLYFLSDGFFDYLEFFSYNLQYLGNQLLGVLLGLYLFFRGEWIVNRAIPSNRPYCHECAYALTGLPAAGVCPECGTAYQREVARDADVPSSTAK